MTFDALSIGVIETDAGGAVRRLNPAAARICGTGGEMVTGRPIDEIVRWRVGETEADDPLRAALANGTPVESAEARSLLRPDGTQVSVWVRASPQPAPEGAERGGLLIELIESMEIQDRARVDRLERPLRSSRRRDPLTGVLNRMAFQEELRDLMNASEKEARHVLLVLDVDDFRVVNDASGHAAGDALLRRLAAVIGRHVDAADVVGRIGDDEFAVLLPDRRIESAYESARTLRTAIEELRFTWEGRAFRCKVSIGLVPVTGEADAVGLLTAASNASYVAKHDQTGGVYQYSADDTLIGLHVDELRSAREINVALDEDRLRLYYQPIHSLAGADETMSMCEILVRMVDREGGIVAARDFIPAAEKYALAPLIDRWVVETSLRTLEEAAASADDPPVFGINLSGSSIARPSFLDFTLDRLEQNAVPTRKICFEITETAAVAHLDATLRFTTALRQKGCRLALDDFGTGLSSFAYLRDLPVDFLKIDGSLVQPVADDASSHAVVEAIVQVARRMGLETIGEWVEEEKTLEALRAMGVDHVQGRLLDAPVPLIHDR